MHTGDLQFVESALNQLALELRERLFWRTHERRAPIHAAGSPTIRLQCFARRRR